MKTKIYDWKTANLSFKINQYLICIAADTIFLDQFQFEMGGL